MQEIGVSFLTPRTILFLLLCGLLLSACSKEEYENPFETTLEQKDGKLTMKFVMPFAMDKIHSGDMANKWLELRLISQSNPDLMTVRTKFLPNGTDRTNVEIEFPEGKSNLNGRYVLCVTPLYKASANTRASEGDEGEEEASRYVIEVSDNIVTSVTKANNMTGFQHGDGSEENPYQIANADDFYMLLYNLYKDDTDAAGVYFQQTGDISWTDVEEKSISTGMNKIESFASIYDGNGYSINDMTYQGANNDSHTNVGLFTELKNGAEVRNLNLGTISFVNVYKNCGAVAGSSSGNVTIDNITISGSMSFDKMGENIGGILGYANNGVQKITNITTNLSINAANTKVGGVVGYESEPAPLVLKYPYEVFYSRVPTGAEPLKCPFEKMYTHPVCKGKGYDNGEEHQYCHFKISFVKNHKQQYCINWDSTPFVGDEHHYGIKKRTVPAVDCQKQFFVKFYKPVKHIWVVLFLYLCVEGFPDKVFQLFQTFIGH